MICCFFFGIIIYLSGFLRPLQERKKKDTNTKLLDQKDKAVKFVLCRFSLHFICSNLKFDLNSNSNFAAAKR